VPTDECIGFDDNQRRAPIEKPTKRDHHQPEHRRGSARFRLPFQEKRKLLSQEQVLRHKRRTGADQQSKEYQQVCILHRLANACEGPDRIIADHSKIKEKNLAASLKKNEGAEPN
jgi:hypothetical protein